MQTNCGVYGIYSKQDDILSTIIEALRKMQHRGQESCGLSYLIDNRIWVYKQLGLVSQVFDNFDCDISKNIYIGTGHVRYSTSGKSKISNIDATSECQPMMGNHPYLGEFTLIHNGNIPFLDKRKKELNILDDNITSDTQLIIKYIEKQVTYTSWVDILKHILNTFQRAYCLILLTFDGLYAIRDKYGVRPLSVGKNSNSYCIASESCCFENHTYIRDVQPGEIVSIKKIQDRLIFNSEYIFQNSIQSRCLFEYIYFMNKNSITDYFQATKIRYQFGVSLAKTESIVFENPEEYLVVGAPNTGICSGKGYADTLNLPYNQVIKKRPKSGRTFILENDAKRILASKNKYLYDSREIKDKKIIILDDSLVRGITLTNIIKNIRECGAKEVHIRISSPPVKDICYYGVDIPTKSELIANNFDIMGIQKQINADSLVYLDLDSIKNLFGNQAKNMCTGCFNSDYRDKLEW